MHTEDRIVNSLRDRCLLGKSLSACKTLDLYIAVSGVIRRLESLLDLQDLLRPRPPEPPQPQPDPPPLSGGRLGRFLAGDPETDPAQLFPVAGPEWDRKRLAVQLEAAQALRGALEKITAELDDNIRVLYQYTNSTSMMRPSDADIIP